MTGFDLRITDATTGLGFIRLGAFRESIRVAVARRPSDWYQAQWRYALGRLVALHCEAVVVISAPASAASSASLGEIDVRPPGDEWQLVRGVGECWTFVVDDDGLVVVHNQLLFFELTAIDGFDVVRIDVDDEEEDEEDEPVHPPSRWHITLDDVRRWLEEH